MIELTDLSFNYRKKQSLFQRLNLKIPEGYIYGLLGKNGAGKTTLLKLIAGVLFPKTGTAKSSGYNPKDRHPDYLADLYFIPEDLYVPNIKMAAYLQLYAPFYPKFDEAQFQKYLSEFEIPQNESLTSMSYGQKKKFLLSFGLATNVKLLILDEPTNGLDIPSKSQFRKLLAGAIHEERTIIISTHQVRDMANLIDPIIILENGEIIFQQALEAITQHLYFELVPTMEEPEGVLYAERVPGGFFTVSRNENKLDSEVDIEVLFNAVVSNKAAMQEIFQVAVAA